MQNGLCGGIGIKSNKIAEIGCVKMLTHPIFCIIAFVEKFALNKQYIKNANSIDNDGTRLCVFLMHTKWLKSTRALSFFLNRVQRYCFFVKYATIISKYLRKIRREEKKTKEHPNGWLFWYCKDLKDFKVVKDYSSLVQLVCNIRRYER